MNPYKVLTIENPDGSTSTITEHRFLMEKWTGRKLLKSEIVHHADKNGRNNKRKNLLLLRSAGAHKRLHSFARRHELEISLISFKQAWLFRKCPKPSYLTYL